MFSLFRIGAPRFPSKSVVAFYLALLWLMPASLLFAPTPASLWALASADFDGDGKADLVVAGPDQRGVSILLSIGRTVDVPLNFTPLALAAGDVNGDGKPDLVVASPTYVAVLLSNGDGTFQDAVKYEIADSLVAVAVGDLNGDGRGDLIVLGARSQRVLVLLSNANGTMQPPISYAAGRMPTAVAVGDFNRDGRLDLVVADAGTNELLLFLGNGDGTFEASGSYAAGPLPRSLAVGDFNGDGIADVAVTGLGDGKVRLLLGTAPGRLEPGGSYEVGMGWTSIVAADLEGRGKLDLVWTNPNTGTLSTMPGRGDGSFSHARELVAGHAAAASTTTLVTSPTGSVTFGQQVTLTGTVSPAAATGKVTFYDGTTILGVGTVAGGQAVLSTTLLAAGNRSLTALYGGDTTYAPSLSTAVALTVNTDPSTTFLPAGGNPFEAGRYPNSVAMGDFNGDGKADLAVANDGLNGAGNVTVLLGNGNGGFTAASGSPFAAGTYPRSLAVADFNGDGMADLVVANYGSNNVTVLLGNGSGGFTAASGSPFAVGSYPFSVAVGDFNGDGKADLAVANANFGSNNLTVLLGNGSGGFTEASGSPFAPGGFLAVGDFNGDGKADLAVANSNSNNVTVLLGNGSGGFTAASGSPFAAGGFLAVGDFNGDGRADLAVANGNNVTVLLGNGSGGFTAASGSPFAAGNYPTSVAVGDFNGDGKADLAVADSGSNSVTVLLGNGSGGFTAASESPFAAGSNPDFVVVGDFNGDGKADLAVANAHAYGTVTVLLGARPVGVTMTTLAASPNPSTLGQAVMLTATVNPSTATGLVTFYDGTTVLAEAAVSSGRAVLSTIGLQVGPRSVRAFYNGDAAYLSSTSTNLSLTVNANRAATFAPPSGSPFAAGSNPASVAVGDFNGDGKVDLAVANYGSNNVTVLLGDGSGGFTAAGGSPFGGLSNPISVAVADFNGDGKEDLAVAESLEFDFTPYNVTVSLGNGSGGFTASRESPFPAGALAKSVAVGDFNGDGKADLAVANYDDNDVTVLLGDGNGGFMAANQRTWPFFMVGTAPKSVAVGDFNGDGRADLVVANYGSNNVTILLGDGSGGFTAASGSPFAAGSNPASVAVGDFNGDGKADLAVANYGGNNVTILLGNGSGGFTAASGSPFAAGSNPASVAVGDFNGDGKVDLAVANYGSNNVTVLLGDGSGGFTPAGRSPFAAGSNPISVAVADFNGDGRADLVVANYGSNDVTVLLGIKPPPGDFDSNGVPDLVIQNDTSRQVAIYYMGGEGGASITGFGWIRADGIPGWTVSTVADLNGDGVPDVIIQNDMTRQVGVYYMGGAGGASITGFGWIRADGIPGWTVKGAADLNGDGVPDVIIQNDSTRQVAVYYMGGGGGASIIGFGWIRSDGIPGWSVKGAADLNGDGVPDVIIQNDTTRQIAVYYMGGAGGTTIAGFAWIRADGIPGWSVVGLADLNGDGVPDVIIENDTTRQVAIYYMGGMGGTTITGFAWIRADGIPGWTALSTR